MIVDFPLFFHEIQRFSMLHLLGTSSLHLSHPEPRGHRLRCPCIALPSRRRAPCREGLGLESFQADVTDQPKTYYSYGHLSVISTKKTPFIECIIP